MRIAIVIEATISLSVEVEADTLEECVALAREAGPMTLCHQCARGAVGEWSTSGELDCDPSEGELVDVHDLESGSEARSRALYKQIDKIWNKYALGAGREEEEESHG